MSVEYSSFDRPESLQDLYTGLMNATSRLDGAVTLLGEVGGDAEPGLAICAEVRDFLKAATYDADVLAVRLSSALPILGFLRRKIDEVCKDTPEVEEDDTFQGICVRRAIANVALNGILHKRGGVDVKAIVEEYKELLHVNQLSSGLPVAQEKGGQA